MPFITDRLQDAELARRTLGALRDESRAPVRAGPDSPGSTLASSRFTFDLSRVESALRDHIVGQDPAIRSVVQFLSMIRADIADPRKPLASMLFTGPTGVGKTETVRLIARALHEDADAVCRIDMNTLAQEHYAASLTGAPPGYVGSKEGTTIFDQAKIEGSLGVPGLVLFDELEKASPEVVLALLNVLDNGILTVASGERAISFRNAIVFMTSNIDARPPTGARSRAMALFGRSAIGSRRSRQESTMQLLLERFPPEFVNRIDHVELFERIESTSLARIVDVELERLNLRLSKHRCRLELEPEVVEFLVTRGYDDRFGARDMRRTMRRHIEFPLANFLLGEDSGTLTGESIGRVAARLRSSRIVFEPVRG